MNTLRVSRSSCEWSPASLNIMFNYYVPQDMMLMAVLWANPANRCCNHHCLSPSPLLSFFSTKLGLRSRKPHQITLKSSFNHQETQLNHHSTNVPSPFHVHLGAGHEAGVMGAQAGGEHAGAPGPPGLHEVALALPGNVGLVLC